MKKVKEYTSLLFVSFLFVCGSLFFGCSDDKQEKSASHHHAGHKQSDASYNDQQTLKVGVISGVELQLMHKIAQVCAENYKLHIEVVEFFNYNSVNSALAEGKIDVNAFQHEHYLKHQLRHSKIRLSIVGHTFLYPMAGYSKKISNIKSLKDGATIALPSDTSNKKRALLLLERKKLIDLQPPKESILDITKNDHQFKFIPLDASHLYDALDTASLVFINATFAASKGLSLKKDSLIHEDKNNEYRNIIVSRENNKNDPKIQLLIKAYKSKEVLDYARELFGDTVIFED